MKKAASIFLRAEVEPRDVLRLSDWMQNRRVTRYLNEDACASQQLIRLLETTPTPMLACRFNQRGRFFLICNERQDSIGFARLKEEPGSGCCEIVFAIGEERLWGNGYGTQAVRAVQSHAFLERRARKLTANIYHGNARSVKTICRCGFHEEERLQKLSRYSITMDEYLNFLKRA